MDAYIESLAKKNMLRMITYVGQKGITEDVLLAFKRLRKEYLASFPPALVKQRKVPQLVVIGFTSNIADVLPLRSILMRPNILSHIPSELAEFKDAVQRIIPCFKYGERSEGMYINTTAVARDANQHEYRCLCNDEWWQKYAVLMKDGTRCMVTTDASCLRDNNAAAVLELQAGFRSGYAENLMDLPFFESLQMVFTEYINLLCYQMDISRDDVRPWEDALFEEIEKQLAQHLDGEIVKPLTGGIDFQKARVSFKKFQHELVFSRVDKAANCICIMCKACYVRLATDELEGPGYQRLEGELIAVQRDIVDRQWEFFETEKLPITQVKYRDEEDEIQYKDTEKLPTRYLTPKLHKKLVATRGITACCGTTTEGVAKIVNTDHVCMRYGVKKARNWVSLPRSVGLLVVEKKAF